MLLEVYAIKRSDCIVSKIAEQALQQRHLFEMSSIHIRQSKQFPDNAEIITHQSDTYMASESYDKLLARIALQADIIRAD